jgi:hypothetical protein
MAGRHRSPERRRREREEREGRRDVHGALPRASQRSPDARSAAARRRTCELETVLVVDDEDECAFARRRARHRGVPRAEARDGERALEVAKSTASDRFVTDVAMPKMKGPEPPSGCERNRRPRSTSGYAERDTPTSLGENNISGCCSQAADLYRLVRDIPATRAADASTNRAG